MELTYISENGKTLTLRQRKPFFLQRVDGVGNLRNAVNTFKAPNQDGAFFISGSLEMRNITLEGTVIGNTVDQTFEDRKRLLRVFTPKLKGTLRYRGVQIPCVVEEAVFIATESARAPSFFISLLCPSPFFEALDELRVELASWIQKFSFPLEIPEGGIEMGSRQLSQIITVDNVGDVPCRCTISFKALGSVTNPNIMNMDTGETMRLLETMIMDEELLVYTHFAGKRVVRIYRGVEENAFSLLDTDSVFLQLPPGRNTVRYGADENIDLLEVSLYYRPLFLTV